MFFVQRIESLNLVQFGAATVIFFQMSTLVGVSWQGKLKITMLHFKRCYDPSLNHCLLHHSHFPSFSHSGISVYLGSFRCSDGCLLFDRMDVEPPLYWAWSWIHYHFQKLTWRGTTPLSYIFFLRICVNILRILKENAVFSHLCGFLWRMFSGILIVQQNWVVLETAEARSFESTPRYKAAVGEGWSCADFCLWNWEKGCRLESCKNHTVRTPWFLLLYKWFNLRIIPGFFFFDQCIFQI